MSAEQKQITELLGRVESLETQLASYVQEANRANSPYHRIFLAKRDSEDPAKWKEWTVNNGEIAEFEAGRECTDEEGAAALIDPAEEDEGDQFAFLMEVRDFDGGSPVHRYVKMSAGSPVRLVDLVADGGDGTVATPYTYTATDPDTSEELGTGLVPHFGRQPYDHDEADEGWGVTIGGVFVLFETNEQELNEEACP